MSEEFYLPSGAEAGHAEEWGEQLHQAFRLRKLRELAIEYNATAPSGYKIDVNRYTTPDELIFALWVHGVEIPEVLTYGEPYDNTFDVAIFWERQYHGDTIQDVSKLMPYQVLKHAHKLPEFLYFSLLLTGNVHYATEQVEEAIEDQIETNLDKLNTAWLKLPVSQGESIRDGQDFKEILKSGRLTDLDLAYLALEAHGEEMYNIGVSVYTYLNYIIGGTWSGGPWR
jgi:hypothetical protein